MEVVERVPKSVVNHCIDKLAFAHRIAHTVAVAALHHSKGSHRHIFHTAGNNDVSIAGFDHLSCHIYAVETGAAYYVNRNGGNLNGKTCLDGCLTSHVLTQTGLNDTAHVNMVNLLRFNAGAVESFFDYDRTKLSRRSTGECAAHLADSCTASAGNNNFLHKLPPLKI